jgi:hypothetical protein
VFLLRDGTAQLALKSTLLQLPDAKSKLFDTKTPDANTLTKDNLKTTSSSFKITKLNKKHKGKIKPLGGKNGFGDNEQPCTHIHATILLFPSSA